jgi:hypothetical protein
MMSLAQKESCFDPVCKLQMIPFPAACAPENISDIAYIDFACCHRINLDRDNNSRNLRPEPHGHKSLRIGQSKLDRDYWNSFHFKIDVQPGFTPGELLIGCAV